jgi:hypothetical protein
MPEMPCGICGESANDQDNCLLCFAITVATLLKSPGANAKTESFIAKPDDGNGWRAYFKITFLDGRGNGRLEVWADPTLYDTQETAGDACEELHRLIEAYWETADIETIELPEGRNAN